MCVATGRETTPQKAQGIMGYSSSGNSVGPPSLDLLAAAFHEAASTHAGLIKCGTDRQILTAYRAVLVAEAALYRDSGGAADIATADGLGWEIEIVDRDLADLATGRLGSGQEQA